MKMFDNWLDTFIEEKEIPYANFKIEHAGNTHYIDNDQVIELMKQSTVQEQQQIKNIMVMIDFKNGDINHFLEHLAKGFVVTHY